MNVPPNVMVWLQLVGLLAAEVALIAGSGALLQRFIRSAWGRRTLWQVCLLSLLVLPFCELTGVARALAGRLVGRAEPRATATQTASDVPPDLSAEFRKEVAGRVALNAEQAGADPAKGQSDIPSGRAGLPLSTVGLPSAHRRQRPLNPAAGTEDMVADSMTILYSGLVWLGGTAAVMGRSFLGAVLLLLLRQRQRAEVGAALQERIARLACQLGLKRRVRLVESARLGGPIVFGVFRPVIGLPRDFAHRFSPAQQEVVLAHELAHLAAWDPLWYGLANLARALLWWHPLVWWVRRQLHSASEQAADEASLLVADGPGVLAECLVELGARLTQERSFVRLGVEGTGLRSGLGRRVERLVQLRESSWTRPGRRGSALAKTLGPAGLVSAVILCTAWVGPPAFNKGESMKTMSQTWSRSLAALALLTSLQEETHAASAANALRSDKPVAIAARVQDGQRLYEAGNLDAAESILKEAASRAPDNGNVSYYLTLLQERGYAQGEKDPNRTQTAPARVAEKPATPEPAPAPAASNPETKPVPEKPGATDDENYRRYNRLMMERYGLIPRGAPLNQNEGNPISARLEKIVLNEVMFDGVPLPEVLKLLDEESRKRDPEKHGINFLINPNGTPGGAIQTIDPNTGQPTSLPPTEPLDMSSVIIRFNLPLRNVRLKDVLDAVVKVADKPIEYSVEDYGLVFSAAPNPAAGSGSALRGKALEAAPLQVRTFRVDTNNFLAGLKRAFATGSELKENATPDQIRSVLVDVFTRLGINMDLPGKTVFYNDLTGIVMVRATFDDLEIVRAAIETLGGAGSEEAGAQNSAKDGAGPIKYNADMMRRYGLPPSKN